jgi:tetratricopeptide (TPR) repeat protein
MIFSDAEAWEAAGRPDLAIDAYSVLIDAQRGGADALIRRSALRRELGALQEAQADLEHAAEIAPDNPYPMMRLGQLAHAAGRNIKAAQWQCAALARAPDNAEMRVNAAAACSNVEWLDLAYKAARPLQEDVSDWWAAARNRALAAFPAEHAAALATLRSRHDAEDPAAVCWTLIHQFYRLGRIRVATRLCESMMRDRPHSFPVFAIYARLLARTSGPEAAVSFLEAHAWLHRNSDDYHYVLARMLQEAGRYEDVLEITKHNSIEDENEDLRYTKSIAKLLTHRDAELREYCCEWTEQSPRSLTPAGFVCSAHFLKRLGEEEAIDTDRVDQVSLVHFWDKPEVPGDVLAVMASWLHHHPSIQQRIFDEEGARDFIRRCYGGDAVASFDRCTHAAMKADVFRVAYLAQEGGVWIDADEACLRPVPQLLVSAAESEATAALSGDVPAYLHNFFLGARAGSRVMLAAFEDAVAAVDTLARDGAQMDIWQVTGPGLITRMVGSHLTKADAVHLAPVRLLALNHYRSFASNQPSLAYKRSPEANWQLL